MAFEEFFSKDSTKKLTWTEFQFGWKCEGEGEVRLKSESFAHPLVPSNRFNLIVRNKTSYPSPFSFGIFANQEPSPIPVVHLVCNDELIHFANPADEAYQKCFLRENGDSYKKGTSSTFWIAKDYKLKNPSMPLSIQLTLYYQTKSLPKCIDDGNFTYKIYLHSQESEGLHDFKLISADKKNFVGVHRLVLAARSSYFGDLFSSESPKNSLELNVPFNVLTDALPLIYEQNFNLQNFNLAQAIEQFKFARVYGFSSSQTALEYLIASMVNEDSLTEIEELISQVPSAVIEKAVSLFKGNKSAIANSTSTFEFNWTLDVPLSCVSESFAHPCISNDTFHLSIYFSKEVICFRNIILYVKRETKHSANPIIRLNCNGHEVHTEQLKGSQLIVKPFKIPWLQREEQITKCPEEFPTPIRIKCTISYPFTELPSRNLPFELEDQLNEYISSPAAKALYDVKLKPYCGDPVQAHRLVLAAGSSYFKSMFSPNWSLRNGYIELDFPEDVVLNALPFIYDKEKDGRHLEVNEAIELFKFADRYGFVRILKILEIKIAKKVLEYTIAKKVLDEPMEGIKRLLDIVPSDVIKNAVDLY